MGPIKTSRILLCATFALTFHRAISQVSNVPPLQREITLQVVNEPVAVILQKIEKLAGITFSYNSNIIDDKQRISATFNKKSVEQVILLMFDGKIKCKAKDDHVILTQNTAAGPGYKKDQKRSGRQESDTGRKSTIIRDTVVKVIRDTVFQVRYDTVYRDIRDTSDNSKIEFGISAGLNLASADIAGSGITPAGNGGGFICIRMTKRLSFRQEILFSVKGYKYSASEEIPPYTISTAAMQQFYYAEIPLLLEAAITRHFSAAGGPYLGILLDAPFTSETSVNGVLNHRESGNNIGDFRAGDFGISAGLAYDLSRRISLLVRYSRGLTNLNKNAGTGAIHHAGVSLNIAYRIK